MGRYVTNEEKKDRIEDIITQVNFYFYLINNRFNFSLKIDKFSQSARHVHRCTGCIQRNIWRRKKKISICV